MRSPTPTPPGRHLPPRERRPSVRITSPIVASTAAQIRRRPRKCPNSWCQKPDIQEADGQTICFSCGTVVSHSVIVNEVTYGEAASGAAIVQGTTVHGGARTAKTTTTGFRRGPRTSDEITESALKEAKEEIERLANALQISGSESAAANHLYTLARLHHFNRPKRENAGICLYIACRQSTSNGIMLIDFADQLNMNVFDLGATYKQFLKAIGMEEEIEDLPQLEIEPLLLKYAKRLEFGTAHENHKVANDAALVLSRMDRDWMKTGRQPAALIGASLVLAARMNNYRRTVREVVYIVKAGEITIQKRLEEFRRTKAGQMTVQQFRELGGRLKEQADPPILYAKKMKELQKRKLDEITRDSDETNASDEVNTITVELRQGRRDKDGFAIPDPPAYATPQSLSTRSPDDRQQSASTAPSEATHDDDNPSSKKKARRTKRVKRSEPQPYMPAPEELLQDDHLEGEIENIVQRHGHEDQYEVSAARAKVIADMERRKVGVRTGRGAVSSEIIIAPDEFESDPEVANCLLSKREIETKERIWTNQNWEWLKTQQQKILDAELEKAQGKRKRKKKDGPATKRGRHGDGSILDGTSPQSPAEAAMIMLRKKSIVKKTVFSRHLNYEKLQGIYSPLAKSTASSSMGSESTSRESTLAPSEADAETGLQTPAATQSQQRREGEGSGSKDQPSAGADDAATSSESDDDDDDGDREHFEEYADDVEGEEFSTDGEDFDEEEMFGG